MMKITKLYSAGDLADAYRVHRSTITRRMLEIGISGHKIGRDPKAPRRYDASQIRKLELYLGLTVGGDHES